MAVAVLVGGALSGREASARISMLVSPALLDFHIEPGKSASQKVSCRNRGAHPIGMGHEVRDLRVGPNGRRSNPAPATLSDSVVPWVTVTPPYQVIGGGETKKFTVTVSVPADAKKGAYATVALASSRVQSNAPGQSVGVGAVLPVQVFVDTGRGHREVKAEVVSVEPPQATSMLQMQVRFENAGEVHAVIETEAEIIGPMEDFIGHISPKQGQIILLPGESKIVGLEWGGELVPATYEAIVTAFYNGGLTVATTTFVVGEQRARPFATDARGADTVHPVGEIIETPVGATPEKGAVPAADTTD